MKTKLTASHASQLPSVPDGVLPEWYHLLPKGVFQGRDGRGPYVLNTSEEQAVTEAFSRLNCDLPIDYEHQSLDAREKSGPVPAAGWIKELASRVDGLWGRVEWTPTAQSCLRAKEYRYISPVFVHDQGGHVRALTMAALTNTPNLCLQAAASRGVCGSEQDGLVIDSKWGTHCIDADGANSVRFPTPLKSLNFRAETLKEATTMDELREKLCSTLGLGAEASDDEILKCLEELKKTSEDAGEEAAQSRVDSAANSEAMPDPAKYVPMDMFQAVNNRLSQLETAQAKEKAEGAVTAAMSAGKLTPAQKDWAISYASRDLAGFKAFVDGAPVIVAVNSQLGAKPEVATGALTPEQKSVAAAMGIDTAKYLKTLQGIKEGN